MTSNPHARRMPRVELIAAADTIALRHSILRPHQTPKDCVYPGDALPGSFHVGVFTDDQLRCIASFSPEVTDRASLQSPCRLRGMATAHNCQRQGLGTLALAFGEKRALQLGFVQLWCNARTTALGFYKKLGYTAVSEPFTIEGIGEHFVLAKRLETAD